MIFRNVLGTEMNKIKVKMNKPLYICMLILEVRKKLRYKSWYHSIKSKYQGKVTLSYVGTYSFTVDTKTENVY